MFGRPRPEKHANCNRIDPSLSFPIIRAGHWAGLVPGLANLTPMPDIASLLLRKSVGALATKQERCGKCDRTPLAGERLHEMDTGRVLCELCLLALPEDKRRAVRSERVHASERHLAVAPRAA